MAVDDFRCMLFVI